MDSLINKPDLTPEQNLYLLAERNRDLAQRSIWGISTYVLCWSVIAVSALLGIGDPKATMWIYQASAMLLLVAFFRLYITYRARDCASSRRLCCFYLHVGVVISAVAWGLVVAQTLMMEAFAEFRPVLIGATIGIMVGGAFTSAPSRTLWVAMLLCTSFPIVLVTQSLAMIDQLSLNLMFLMCIVICGCIATQFYRNYHELAVSRLMVEQKAKELSTMVDRDGLTGVFNRRFFDTSLSHELKRASRGRSTLSLLLIDLDHFKMVNDTYGHMVGDKVLKSVSQQLSEIFHRDIDIVARYGGEEFAVLLPYTHQNYAHTLAESVRKRIEQQRFQTEQGELRVTASIGGYTLIPTPSSRSSTVVDKADKALYQAKDAGRNRVRFFDDSQVFSAGEGRAVLYPASLMK